MKQTGIKAAKVLLFIGIGILLFLATDRVLRMKSAKGLEQFYGLERGSVDVLFVGSSHVYRNINPAVLFEQEGIAAYDLGSPAQPVWNSYYYTVEALKTQKPKLIVLEVYKITMEEPYADAGTTVKALSGMRYSKNRWNNVVASVENPDDRFSYFVGLPIYHSRYSELTVEDFAKNYGNPYYDSFLGFQPIEEPKEYDIPRQLGEITESSKLPEKSREYLDRFVKLANEEGVSLMFLVSPFCATAAAKQPYWNALEQYAKEKGIPFLNGNLCIDKIGMDGKTDFGEANHLSHSGADKFSSFLCQYLKQRYDLPDRREDPAHSRWQKNVDFLNGENDIGTLGGDIE